MIGKFKEILGKNYYPLNRIEISRRNLIGNYKKAAALSASIKIAPVIKSNAYGHGIDLVAKILDAQHPPFFCVDSLFEAYQLKKIGIKSQILIMGYVDERNISIKKLPFSYAVFDLGLARALNDHQPGAKIHLKIDTGMHRLGITLDELPSFIKELLKMKNLKVEGVMSHLASASQKSSEQTVSQLKNFQKAKEILEKAGITPRWSHIAASGALFSIERRKLERVSNVARVGIALYGADFAIGTKPVLRLTSKLAQIKSLKKGDLVGYEGTFRAPTAMKIGLLPIGYNDGLDRRLSNIDYVLYGNTPCKIVGRISMNITAIDLSKIPNPKIGDEITVISDQPGDPNSITNLAKTCATIPHDIFVHLHAKSIKRVIL